MPARGHRRALSASLSALLLLSSGRALSAPLNYPQDNAIVVRGRLKQAVSHFVDALTRSGPTDQIARWKDVICPVVLGIDPNEAAFMEKRIVSVGHSVGLRAERASCLTTMAIVVTPDPNGFTTQLLHDYPITLRTDGWDRLKRFVNSDRPVRWISVTDECGFSCGLPGSRLSKDTSPALSAMIVVVDSRQLQGVSIGELSDYVSVVALSNPPDQPSVHPNSILALFDDPRNPAASFALTDYDLSFLDGLYNAPVNKSANVQRSTINSRMRKALGTDHPHP